MHILLAADSGSIRKILRGMLRHLGSRYIHEATNTQESLTVIRTRKIDLMVLHLLRTTGSNSLDCLEAIHAEGHVIVPAVLCSGTTDANQEARAWKLGVKKYMVQPFSLEMLYSTLSEVIRGLAQTTAQEGNDGI